MHISLDYIAILLAKLGNKEYLHSHGPGTYISRLRWSSLYFKRISLLTFRVHI